MKLKNKVYSNYENVKKADIDEIWEVVILDTYNGIKRLEYLMTEDLDVARKLADNYKNKLNNCEEIIMAKLVLINDDFREVFARIVFSKRNNEIKEMR